MHTEKGAPEYVIEPRLLLLGESDDIYVLNGKK